jgi:DNA-binding CsgD family transcriptional regulator
MTGALMITNDRLSALIGEIYDTALDPTHWSVALQQIVDFTGAQGCGLVATSPNEEIRIGYSIGVAPEFMQLYVDTYRQFDPMSAIQLSDVGRVYSTEDWVPIEDFRKGRFYQEWARPQGLEDAVNALLDRSAEGVCHFSLMTAGGPVDQSLRQAMHAIVPHLRRAILLGQTLLGETTTAAPIVDMLDALKTATFLLDARGNITHSNMSGQDLLYRNDFLRSVLGRLVASDPNIHRTIREAIASCPESTITEENIALPFVAKNGDRFVGHLVPLTAGRRRQTGIAYDATAALFVSKASLDLKNAPQIIRRIFKLTPAELRVFLAIAEIGGVAETAKSLDIAETTVKTHLSRIFTKTDTGRQADLVRLLAAFSSPLKE